MVKKPFNRILIIAVLFTYFMSLGMQAAFADTVLQNIDTRNYPIVRLSLSYIALENSTKDGQGRQVIEINENGQHLKDVTINTSKTPLKTKRDPISVSLLIDASGSMKGKPLDDAKAAAKYFIGLLGSNDRVSVISFNSKPSLIANYTSDKNKLVDSIGTIQASGETAVYDALSLATGLVAKSGFKQNYVILLSDGGDTVSETKSLDCINVLKSLKVPVYTIALKSPEFDVGALESISVQSGGKLAEALNSSYLKPFYSRLAKQIKNQVEISYKSPGFRTKDIDLDISIGKGSQLIHVSTAYENPVFLQPYNAHNEGDIKITPITDSWAARSGILLIAFLSAALLAYGIFSVIFREKSLLQKQMGMYEDIWSNAPDDGAQASNELNPYVGKAMDVVGHFAEKRGLVEFVRIKLEQAGLPLRPVEYISFHLLLIAIPAILFQLVYGSFFLSILVSVALIAIPMLVIQAIIDRRRKSFNEMLPDTMTMIAGSLRAGYGLLQALALVSDESKPPVSVEFRRTLTEARLGLPIEVALEKAAKRVGSKDFQWAVLAINIQREVGGNLAEILDIVAKTVREREALSRQVKSLTAEGRLSSYILIALPFFTALLLFVMNKSYMMALFTNVYGWSMVIIALILMSIGIVWMKRIISIEV